KLYLIEHFMHTRSKRTIGQLFRFVRAYYALAQTLRKEQYDLCLVLRAYGANLITLGRLIPPKCVIGHGTAAFAKSLDIAVPWAIEAHEAEHFSEVLYPIGVKCNLNRLEGAISPSLADEQYVSEVCKQHALKEFIAIHPFAGD